MAVLIDKNRFYIQIIPKNQNLKTAESHRVVLFRKSAGKLVKNGLKHN